MKMAVVSRPSLLTPVGKSNLAFTAMDGRFSFSSRNRYTAPT
jgi:hypothetical protein